MLPFVIQKKLYEKCILIRIGKFEMDARVKKIKMQESRSKNQDKIYADGRKPNILIPGKLIKGSPYGAKDY